MKKMRQLGKAKIELRFSSLSLESIILISLLTLFLFCSVVAQDASWCTVQLVVDGDTVNIKCERELKRVRLIGVDSAEKTVNKKLLADSEKTGTERDVLMEFGSQATQFLRQLLPLGSKVRMMPGKEPFDRYGRNLAYLFLENGQMVQEALLSSGNARIYLIKPNTEFAESLIKVAEQAKKESKGGWATAKSFMEAGRKIR